jgi:hypothetical protein
VPGDSARLVLESSRGFYCFLLVRIRILTSCRAE